MAPKLHNTKLPPVIVLNVGACNFLIRIFHASIIVIPSSLDKSEHFHSFQKNILMKLWNMRFLYSPLANRFWSIALNLVHGSHDPMQLLPPNFWIICLWEKPLKSIALRIVLITIKNNDYHNEEIKLERIKFKKFFNL